MAGVKLYPDSVYEGDLTPEIGSEVDGICEEINSSVKGFGTDEEGLLKVMGNLTPEQRLVVPTRYEQLYGKNLKDVMKSECGNRDFGKALQYMAVAPHEMECYAIDAACKGMGTNERLLSTIIAGRSNAEIEILKKTYFKLNTKDLGRVLDSELGGHFEQLIFNCLAATEEDFDPEYHNDDKITADIAAFYKMGQGKWGTDEKGLFKLICASPAEHLINVNTKYAEEHGYTLYKVMEKEMGGDAGKGALFMLGMKLKPYETVAALLSEATKGFGTNETLLTVTLIRYQKIMPQVKEAFVEKFGKPLEEVIKSETGGDYRKLLIELVSSAE